MSAVGEGSGYRWSLVVTRPAEGDPGHEGWHTTYREVIVGMTLAQARHILEFLSAKPENAQYNYAIQGRLVAKESE